MINKINHLKQAILCMLFLFIINACRNKQVDINDTPSFSSYFSTSNSDVENGGIQLIPIQTPKGTFNVWTKSFGHNPKIKVLLLHGGPGCTHEYFECMESFLPREGIQFIYYDQLGSAYSDNPNDSSLWTIDHFVEEVEQVRKTLLLNKENFYLLGHSWGGILAMEYALKYQSHLKGLIISNMMADCKAYGKYANEVLALQMDPVVLDSIRQLEKKGDFDNPLYMNLLIPNYYEQHILRMPSSRWPDPVNRTFAKLNKQVYTVMQGPSEFGISGRLTNWDRSKDLKNITVRTLVIGAKYDTMDPEYMKWMSTQVPGATFLYCPNGSHMCMYDDQEVYMDGLIKFLKNR